MSRSRKKTKGPPAAPGALRILQLNSLLNGGGTDDQCLRLTLELGRLGQKVWLAGPGERPLTAQIAGLPVAHHATPPEGWLKLRFILDCARFIREQRIQIVHGHHGRDYWPAILAARWSRARPKLVLSRHPARSPEPFLNRSLLLGRANAFVAVSEFVARGLREGHADADSSDAPRHRRRQMRGDLTKIEVIHGGIDTSRFKPLAMRPLRAAWGLAPDDFVFGVVGRYDLPPGAGQREFLQAAARIKDRHPHAHFLIIGCGDLAAQLMEDIRRLGLEGRALLTANANDLPAVLNALDCLVHSALGPETHGLMVCEAHACGRPVIAPAADGIPEAFGVGGLGRLVAPGNVEELAGAMEGQMHAPTLTEEERRRIHRRVAGSFSFEVSARNHLALYRKLVG